MSRLGNIKKGIYVCLFCGFIPFNQLELLAIEGVVPWISIRCVCTGVTE